MTLTECRDLRTGDVPWQETDWPSRPSDPFPAEPVDVAIVGSGIVGALIAQRLADSGRRIALFDRRPPGCGSTAASTAEIMWAMDVPMSHLATEIGEAEAARRWTRVLTAVRDLGKRIDALGLNGGRVARPTLYLTGSVLDEAGLVREADIHRRNGLPSVFLRAEEVAERFDIAARAAIASQGGFEIEPVRLCHALLDRARREGANLHWPVDVTGLHPDDSGIVVEMADGRSCRAENVILATGYERASLFLSPAFGLHSTFAIATPPGGAPLWRERAMIWEASDPYLYVRTDRIGRIIAGGEDIESPMRPCETRCWARKRVPLPPSLRPCLAPARSPSTGSGRQPLAPRPMACRRSAPSRRCRTSGWRRVSAAMASPSPASQPKCSSGNWAGSPIQIAIASVLTVLSDRAARSLRAGHGFFSVSGSPPFSSSSSTAADPAADNRT